MTWDGYERKLFLDELRRIAAALLDELRRIAAALEILVGAVRDKVVQTEDVARAKVYSEHLGEKLREPVK